MKTPIFTDLVQTLPATVPFVGPETQERQMGHGFTARLGANESVFGPSPKVLKAIGNAASDIWMYGDPEAYELRNALAKHHNITMDNIIVGEGIDGLLGYLARLFISPGDAVVTSDGAYPTFNYHVQGFGGMLHKVPYCDDHEDPNGLIAMAAKTGAKLIYLANPDNPMGSWHNAQTLEKMIEKLPGGCLLILDEAYADCAPHDAVPPLDTSNPNVIRMRTFSKAYGLAGLRIGYAIGQADLIQSFNKIRNHFGVGRLPQAAALAALDDQAYLSDVISRISMSRIQISEIAKENGLIPLPSATNFVTIDCGKDGSFARAVVANLIKQGIFVRMPFVAPQDRCIRVSCGTADDMAAFAKALPIALQQI
ncbi:pyridoxal phosphate-dependent aminotransferase [Parasulfitobacter algicola]|uniref:histidinol-phosphate transaminase n=1 Tax=Parasulfitobacter algicola TaxID=2614809 RepID=A0ABX2ITU3_9RHOB|nr:pyridoxal phosphate-dependent aminotransferase [Sulfitobacter algicola]NSX54247.1 pyridoxal phosphate-dependent aminotransferase [Sulfitobacter algicola]